MTTPPRIEACPRCGTAVPEGVGWQFCAACGAPLAGATCLRCEAPLTPGASFCHRCGMAAGGTAAPPPARAEQRPSSPLPWAVGGVALLALIALLAGRGLTAGRGDAVDGSLTGLPQRGLEFSEPGRVVRGPDISQLSPQERADRLYNRVMTLAAQGKRDSVAFFAPMAFEAYQLLGTLNEDQHYDVGRIAAVAGAVPLAGAHADSILARSPSHLLGLILAAQVAQLRGDAEARAAYERRLLAAEAAELRRNAPEYERHREEIAAALAEARAAAAAAR